MTVVEIEPVHSLYDAGNCGLMFLRAHLIEQWKTLLLAMERDCIEVMSKPSRQRRPLTYFYPFHVAKAPVLENHDIAVWKFSYFE